MTERTEEILSRIEEAWPHLIPAIDVARAEGLYTQSGRSILRQIAPTVCDGGARPWLTAADVAVISRWNE